jgi:hypothetical protein
MLILYRVAYIRNQKGITMTFFQISIKGNKPNGALFRTRSEAEREVRFLKADDQRYANEALEEAGIIVKPTEYEIHEVPA